MTRVFQQDRHLSFCATISHCHRGSQKQQKGTTRKHSQVRGQLSFPASVRVSATTYMSLDNPHKWCIIQVAFFRGCGALNTSLKKRKDSRRDKSFPARQTSFLLRHHLSLSQRQPERAEEVNKEAQPSQRPVILPCQCWSFCCRSCDLWQPRQIIHHSRRAVSGLWCFRDNVGWNGRTVVETIVFQQDWHLSFCATISPCHRGSQKEQKRSTRKPSQVRGELSFPASVGVSAAAHVTFEINRQPKSFEAHIDWQPNHLNLKSIDNQISWQPKSFESQIRWQPNRLTLNSFESDINWLSNQLNSAHSLPIGPLSLETSATALCGRYVMFYFLDMWFNRFSRTWNSF